MSEHVVCCIAFQLSHWLLGSEKKTNAMKPRAICLSRLPTYFLAFSDEIDVRHVL